MHKETLNNFSKKIAYINNQDSDFLKPNFVLFVKTNKVELDKIVDYTRDLNFGYFAFMTLQKSYLIKINNKIVERPQDMFMRVAVAIHCDDKINITDILQNIKKSYDYMSNGYFTHATPTLFNAGLKLGNLASCFLLGTDDSITGQFKTLGDCAQISKWAGGIGVHVSNVRGKNSLIKTTKGITHGIIPMLKVFNETARYVNQSGRRNGSIAVYLEPWHCDILEFLDLRKQTGAEELRARDLFLALWIPDRFMQAVENNEDWYLMSPDESQNLNSVYGDEFNKLYETYIQEKKYREVIPAETVWKKILESQLETGLPYIVYKDAVNKYSNQKNIGVIKSSNLCVAPETKILTDKGYQVIETLKDKEVNVWNGNEFSKVTVKQTGENQKLIKIQTSDGNELQCTPYHKFHIQNSYSKTDVTIMEAKDLKEDLRLIKCKYPIIQTGLDTYKYPYTAGLFSTCGTYEIAGKRHKCTFKRIDGELYCNRHLNYIEYDEVFSEQSNDDICQAIIGIKKPRLTLHDTKKELVNYLDKRQDLDIHTVDNKINIRLPFDLPEKYSIPIDQNLNIRLQWLSGYLDGNATLVINKTNKQIQISSTFFEFLRNINHLLNTMGVNGKISKMHDEKVRLLPDGNGGLKEFSCKVSYRLLISSYDLYKLYKLGLTCYSKNLNFDNIEEPAREAKQFVKITKIIDENRYANTYCFNEPIHHTGIFNGIIAGNCAEINEVSDHKRYSVCNLASIAVNKFVVISETDKSCKYDYEKLHEVVKQIVYNINRVIDITYYPTEECKVTNNSDRPMGIGIQGVADLFHMFKLSYSSQEAIELEQNVMETIYHASIESSWELACKYGKYSYFDGSDLSKGIFHFEHYNTVPRIYNDWVELKTKVMKDGVRNSLMIALMPTASTSQILGNNECFEPITSNIYTRRTAAGEFILVNKHLIKELIELNIWNEDMREKLIIENGSIQNITNVSDDLKERYKTVWEIKMKDIINHAIARQPYVDQAQSMNLFMPVNDPNKLTSALMYGWKNGLKTGMYYLRTLPASQAQKFTIDANKLDANKLDANKQSEKRKIRVIEAEEVCVSCSS